MNLIRRITFAPQKELAKQLAQQVMTEVPIDLQSKPGKLLSVNKITRLLERTYALAADHRRKNRIGLLGQAVLANNFKWELKNAGYTEEFIDVATEGLVIELSKARKHD